jgi:hypothetical protein
MVRASVVLQGLFGSLARIEMPPKSPSKSGRDRVISSHNCINQRPSSSKTA